MAQKVFVAGAGGFIGGHLTKNLLDQGIKVVAADIKPLEEWFQISPLADNHTINLENQSACLDLTKDCSTIYNLACNMGGMGFIENNRALCMLSVLINTHLLMAARHHSINEFFYASSACIYPIGKQTDSACSGLKELDAYPADPEDGYGWEKLFSERMCKHFQEDFGILCRVARFHNVYGPFGSFDGGREKAPAALCRKVIEAQLSDRREIEIWGDGEQTRSFMYIDDCIVGINKLMESNHLEPINLGRDDLVSINQLVDEIETIADITIKRQYILDAPLGVRGRNSDNTMINKVLNWQPSTTLGVGLRETYNWIYDQLTS
jgi:nucleoside-diphosphate-sugar epimerase